MVCAVKQIAAIIKYDITDDDFHFNLVLLGAEIST